MICNNTLDCIIFGVGIGVFLTLSILGWYVILKEKITNKKLVWLEKSTCI